VTLNRRELAVLALAAAAAPLAACGVDDDWQDGRIEVRPRRA
jgi:hypothetical protein